ncbi:MAG: hypothetical protein IJ366_04120, partial [Clostridia bacterium]|nr:hypothetical protein [Clostridia bacterium]
MTLAEIEEAGIDTTDQANNNMFKYEMTLVIGTQPVKIQGYKPEGDNTPIRVTDADFTVPGSSGNGIYESSGRLTSNTMYVYDFNDKSNGYNYNSETDKNRAPQTIVTYVQVPGEVTWLKEFFDVSLSVFNQAEAKFIIKDCSASLIYPTDGLTLDSKTPQTVSMGDIAGQSSQTANWILRGDTEGEYPIKADFKGDLGVMENEVFTSWDIPISQIFESERPIKVYGSEGLSFVIECENEVVALTDSGITDGLAFRVGLKNGSVLTRYMTGASVAETEDDNIIPLTGYQNYIENSNGDRYADSSELKYGETVYSDYIITGLDSTQDIKELIINRLREASAYPNLPLEFKEAAPRTFHSRRIEAYGIDENGEKLPVNVVSVKEDESMTFAVHITELLPGAEEYTDCSGIDVYVNGEYEGKTDEYGVLEYTYTAPAYNAKKSNQKLTFQGERTAETSIMIQVLDNTTYLKGYVHDTYGNILRDVAVKISSVAKDGTEEVVAETTT